MNITTYRYHEAHGGWALSVIKGGGSAPYPAERGALGTQPEWLSNLRIVAVIGEHAVIPDYPPPDIFFWFEADQTGEFVQFCTPRA